MTTQRKTTRKSGSTGSERSSGSKASKSTGKKKAPAKAPTTAKKKAKKAAPARDVETARPDDMPEDVLEFITAIDTYKRDHSRPFPTWSEILDIVKELGYSKSA